MAEQTTQNAAQNATQKGRSASDLVLAFFTSPLFMMAALGLALLAQGKHTADVFAFWSHRGTPEWLFYAFAGGVEIAVFIFVLHDHKRTSYAFAVGAFATNVVYYAIGGANLLSAELFPVLLLSVLLPGVIVGYSHTIAEKPKITADAPAKPVKPREHWWQFWRPRATASAVTNTPQRDRQTGLESLGDKTTTATITKSEIEAPSVPPVGVAQTQDAEPDPALGADGTPDRMTPAQRKAQRRTQIAEWQLQSPKQVMDTFGVGKRTADEDLAWVRKNAMHRNGVAK